MRTDFTFAADQSERLKNRQKELELEADSLWINNVRLLKANFGEAFAILIHLKVLRAFVESVLRYGLPPHFLFFTLKPAPKAEKKTRFALLRALAAQDLDGISSVDLQAILNNSHPDQDDLSRSISPEDLEIVRSVSAASIDPHYDAFVKVDLALDLAEFSN